MPDLKTNVLYYGDNLDILRAYIPDESVDLIYLDPPFNSNRSYNVLFRETTGAASEAQIEAFEDTWHWAEAAMRAYDEVMTGPRQEVARMLRAMVDGLGHNDVTAYLSMMAVRLVELHRVLRPTGSLYLHCDPTASHYLKLLMDAIFGPKNFVNEIIWKRSTAHSDIGQGAKHFGRLHDVIFRYGKTDEFKSVALFTPHNPEYTDKFYRFVEPDTGRRYTLGDIAGPQGAAKGNPYYEFLGVSRYWRYSREHIEQLYKEGRIIQTRPGAVPRYKRYLDEMRGLPLQDIWGDISPVAAQAKERLGYQTQKPLALLERIINASSNPGDIVLDPFCGCGTAVHAAQKLDRRWIGIDITYLAINLIERRLRDAFPGIAIEIVGEPKDLAGAHDLARRDKWQFQWWALARLDAQPVAGKKKGSDKGIDGIIPFFAGPKEDYKRAIVSVKGGEHIGVAAIRDLVGVLDREKEPIGVLLTLEPPTRDMTTEAAAAGLWHSDFWQRDYPRVQIITVEEMLSGKRPALPTTRSPFAQASRESEAAVQGELLR